MRILVLGYYHRQNLGDDAFEQAIPLIVGQEHQYRFVCVDSIEAEEANRDPNDHYDLILLGGGDVVNHYFFRKVNPLVSRFRRGPFVLFGAGITWQTCISLGHLDQFDRVFLRNTTDLRCAERRLGTEFAHFLPDLVFSLCPHRSDAPQLQSVAANASLKIESVADATNNGDTMTESADECDVAVRLERPKASFYLIQSIDRANPDNAERQQFVLKRLAQCVEYAAQTHTVFLVRFNTSGTRDGDDLHISQNVYNLCSKQAQEHIFVDSTAYRSPQAMLQQMSSMDINVCMRFHSHIFSTIQQVPFVSLMLTRKVEMLVDELGLEARCGVRLPRDEESRQPLDVPFDQFCERFDYVVEHNAELRDYLRRAYSERHALLKSGVVAKLLLNTSVRPGRKLLPVADTKDSTPSDDKESFLNTLVENASAWWQKRLGFSLLSKSIEQDDAESSSSTTDTHAKRKRRRRTTRGRSFEANNRTLVLSNTNSERRVRHHVNTVCQRLCYSVTDEIQPKFMYGFVENMMRDPFRIREYLKWIIEERERQRTEDGDVRRFHLDFMQQQDFAGAHRSGWSFAAIHLRALHSDRGVLLDTCMDRTFHWGCDALRHGGVLPYTHSWCGIVHHTPSADYTDYNTTAMLANPLFRESLLTCRGIYVLSNSLKIWFDKALADLPVTKVPPVCVLKHPTEVPSRNNRFTIRRFRANGDKKLLHIGAWLRDTFALYKLALLDEASRAVARAEYNHAVSMEVPRTRLRRYRKDGNAATSKGFVIIDGKKHSLRRCMLRGPNMSLYLPPSEDMLIVSVKNGSDVCSCGAQADEDECSTIDGKCTACRHNCGGEAITMSNSVAAADSRSRVEGESKETKCSNKWALGLREFATEEILSGVDIIERLDNAEYDETLCENIVFLNLVEASACNTLIECLVRNTPILINRLPAVEEVLGKDYPFYYESLEDALVKSRCYESICAAHKHLKAIDKTPYRIESFINDVRDSTIYRGL